MFKTNLTVRGYHCDAYGHVNNARYLEFFEECRWAFLSPAQGIFKKLKLQFVVYKINIHYKVALRPEDLVEVSIKRIVCSNMSIQFKQEISRRDKICTLADVHFVLLDEITQKPVPIDSHIQETFNQLINKADA